MNVNAHYRKMSSQETDVVTVTIVSLFRLLDAAILNSSVKDNTLERVDVESVNRCAAV